MRCSVGLGLKSLRGGGSLLLGFAVATPLMCAKSSLTIDGCCVVSTSQP